MGTGHLLDCKREKEIFKPGETYLPASGKVVGEEEYFNIVEAANELWLTEGHWVDEFEAAFFKWVMKASSQGGASMCNSGSSANLLAMLAAKEFYKMQNNQEIVTAACGFPTTINPIIQAGMRPKFIDVELETLVPSTESILKACEPIVVRGIILAHTLGNPWHALEVSDELANEAIAIIEDNCDALGSQLDGTRTGNFGLMATHSFYPAHHMTTGEGGMVISATTKLKKIVESYRDWGRDCWCDPGKDNTCGKRFHQKHGLLPAGYDHKYVYSRIGYNLKSTDIQAAIGMAQLEKLDDFISIRSGKFHFMKKMMQEYGMEEIFHLPRATANSTPSWFGFYLTIRDDIPFQRNQLTILLENKFKVGTRLLFGGNILRQPAYKHLPFPNEGLPNTEKIMRDTFWVGLWPGLSMEQTEYICYAIRKATKELLQ